MSQLHRDLERIAAATILAILRVVSRAWAMNPTGIELDLEPLPPATPINYQTEETPTADDAAVRFGLLDID